MSDDTEQLYGREGNEQAQGYSPLQMAVPDETEPEAIMSEDMLEHFKRPEPPAPVERSYSNVQSGEPTPSNQTVELDRAAEDLGKIRAQEFEAIEAQQKQELNAALDALDQPAETPVEQPIEAPQPEYDPAVAERLRADGDAAMAEADRQTAEFLKDPAIRSRIDSELQAKDAVVEQARQAYIQHANNLTAESNAILFAQYPELSSARNESELRGALQVLAQTNPQRAQAFVQLATRAQQIGIANAQIQSQIQAEQAQRASEAFQRFAQAEDAKVFKGTAPEQIQAIRETIFADAKAAGISEKDLFAAYSTIPAMRHSFVQNLLADGARWRIAQRNLVEHRANPIPKVNRPGVSRGDDGAYQELERQYRGKSLSPKQAAELLMAKRAR